MLWVSLLALACAEPASKGPAPGQDQGPGGAGGGGGGAVCGDGVVDAGEACDEGAENSDTAPDRCRSDCTLPRCGDGVIDEGEACSPGTTAACAAIDAGETGEAHCTKDCVWELGGCWSREDCFEAGEADCQDPRCAEDPEICPRCGDGAITGGEVCDGEALGGMSCAAAGFDEGTLRCASDCLSYDDSGCTRCGDGAIEGEEVCDGEAFRTSCRDEGFGGGPLACGADCRSVDTSGCSLCGNGAIDPGEECDQTSLGASCLSLGFRGGMLSCTAACTHDLSRCEAGRCGDEHLDPGELCDGENLDGASCRDLGYASGSLRCLASCDGYDTSLCSTAGPSCGDGIRAGDEACDDGNLAPGDGCDPDCALEDGGACGPMIDLNAASTPTATGFTYTGSNRAQGNHATPSCGPGQDSDLALAYWVEAAADITFEVQVDPAAAHKADYVLYVRTDCADPSSELACDAGMVGGSTSQVELLGVDAGTQLYLFVDTALGASIPMITGGGFILEATILP